MQVLSRVRKFLDHQPLPEPRRAALEREALDPAHGPDHWTPGQPLADARNEHYTNTPEELEQGLAGRANWLEGDVSREWGIRKLPLLGRFQQPIMAHDPTDVDGLTLHEWLTLGAASNRALKLDFKSSSGLGEILDMVASHAIPQERLMFNSDVIRGPGAPRIKGRIARLCQARGFTRRQLKQIRRRFPSAILALGCLTGKQPEGTRYSEIHLRKLIDIAREVGGPITFPLRAEFVDAHVVATLKPYGTVSIWNDPKTYKPVPEDVLRFRSMGVDGMIDLRS